MGQGNSKEMEGLFVATVKQLARERVRAKDTLWQEFLAAGLAHPKLAEALQMGEVATVVSSQPANIAVLLYKLVNKLQLLIDLGARMSAEQRQQLQRGLQFLSHLLVAVFGSPNSQLIPVLFWTEGELRTDALEVGVRRISVPAPPRESRLHSSCPSSPCCLASLHPISSLAQDPLSAVL